MVPLGGDHHVAQIAHLWRRKTWLEELTLIHQAAATTTLTGSVIDQVRLFTLLNRIKDLNLTLISVKLLDAPEDK